MDRNTLIIIATGAYTLLFLGTVAGIGLWRRSRRGERAPVEFKLLRGPGETLRRRLAAMDENLIFQVIGSAAAPIMVTYTLLVISAKALPKDLLAYGFIAALLAFVITALVSGRWLWSKFVEHKNYQLGYLGERTVAESLAPLLGLGYQVFHDVPAENGGRVFNLDHVVVGPTGLFLIETKTRRKGRARPGFKDHEVAYDGQQLIWPWGEDRHGLEQALAEARWLSDWIRQITGVNVGAKPILALPGWYVKCTARGPVNVVNAKGLVSAIKGRGGIELASEQIDLVARQLDARCRDVED